MFQKSSKKQPSLKRANSTLAEMALSSNQYAVKVQRLEKILAQKAAPKVSEWQSYSNFCKVTLNPHFLKKCKGGPRKVFQKWPKKQPSFQRPKSTLVQTKLFFIQHGLEVQELDNIQAKNAAPKVHEWPCYGNLGKVNQNPHFLKKCQVGTKGNFSKIAQKVALE